MSWLPPPPRKLGGLRARPPAPRVPPVDAMLQDAEGFDPPYGGDSGGEMLPVPQPEEQPAPQPAGLRIEPPEWQDELDRGELDLERINPLETTPETLDAIDRLKLDTGDVEEPRDWAPPVTTEPAPPIQVPKPDWEAELKERTEPAPATQPAAPPPFIPPAPWSKGAP